MHYEHRYINRAVSGTYGVIVMKILLVMPNMLGAYISEKVQDQWYVPAYGIMYISSYLKQSGFDVTTLNLNHYPENKIDTILRKNSFDAVCTGGLFTYMKEFEKIISLANTYNRNVKTIIGGPVATAHPEFALDALNPDFLVIGEGELTTAELLLALDNKSDVSAVRGIAYRQNGQFFQTALRPTIHDLDEIPFPDYDGFEYEYYLDNFRNTTHDKISYLNNNLRSGGVVAGRDCPGKCTFCFRITGGKLRVRSVENVTQEIQYLIDSYCVNDISILDDVFAIKKSRLYQFCYKIKPLKMNWTCQLRVPGVDADLLRTMKESGCYLVSYGFESASNKVLKSMKKGITRKQIENVIPLTREAKITLQANFIFGDPAETLETAGETLRFARKYKWLQLGLNFIKPFPGSPLYHDLIRANAIKNLRHFWINSAYDEDGRLINMTSMNDEEMQLLSAMVYVERMHKKYYNVAHIKRLSKGRFQVTIICPVCKGKTEELVLDRPGVVACPRCLMRSYVDTIDLTEIGIMKKMVLKLIRTAFIYTAKAILNNAVLGLMTVRAYKIFRKKHNSINFSKLHIKI